MDLSDLQKTQVKVQKAFEQLCEQDLLLELDHEGYPGRLGETRDAPRFLFLRGRMELLERPSLAVVGTRNPTSEGEKRAYKLGYLLAKWGITVASGLARGIDRCAHLGTLDHGGDAIGVLGTPLTRSYPQEHAELQEAIGSVGLLVSQFHPGAHTLPLHFPLRNAVMSGLCLGTIVVEASETSGALIQARKCLEQGRRLFIPHSAVANPALRWPKVFLERGATEFATIEEISAVLGTWLMGDAEVRGSTVAVGYRCSLSPSTSRRS